MTMWRAVKAHPFMTAIVLTCTVGGALLTWAIGLEGFGPARSLVAGGVAGAGIAYLVVASRMLGAFGERGSSSEEAREADARSEGGRESR